MLKKATILITFWLVFSLAFAGCAPAGEKVSLAGSAAVQPLAERLALAYMAENPEVTISVSGGGSTVGVKSAWEGIVDIGMTSRELKPEEKGLKEFVIARDGLVVIVHPENKLEGLNRAEVRDIFSGEITNWKDLGGEDRAIVTVSREEGSGTRATFEMWIMGDKLITEEATLLPSNGAIRVNVAGNPDAIGYISFGVVDPSVKTLFIDGVAATADNMKTRIYPLVRPYYFLTKQEPTGEVKKFIDWCLGEKGQRVVATEGYIPVE